MQLPALATASFVPALYLPRRHRRRLLFPPGLLALAGAVLMSCLAMLASPRTLRPQALLQLTMPSLHPTSEYAWVSPSQLFRPYQLNRFRPWHNSYFNADSVSNTQEQRRLNAAVRRMMADTLHSGGVRVYFSPKAHYEQLVFVLDLMNRENVKRYWTNYHRGTTILYAVTKGPDAYSRIPWPRVHLLRID